MGAPVSPKECSREILVYLAKLAEQAERYEEMTEYMKRVAEMADELTVEERNLLSVAYKNCVGGRRASWRILQSLEAKEAGKDDSRASVAADYRARVEAELNQICNDIIHLLDTSLINSAKHPESKVFYYKMKGDYYRYISEFASPEAKSEPAGLAKSAYDSATEIAESELPSTHPIRLGLALNYSVFHYEISNDQEKACYLAQTAFDSAIAELDTLGEDSYKDSTLIMQLLRDNLTLWVSDCQNERSAAQEAEKPEA